MYKLLIFIAAFIFFQSNLISQTNSKPEISKAERKKERQEMRNITMMSLKSIGIESAFPTFRNNFALDGFMHGPVMNYMGFMEIGYLRGTAIKKDYPLVSAQASDYFIGFKYNHVLLRTRSVNFGPSFGLRFSLRTLKDPFFVEDIESNTFGTGIFAGAFLKLGPILLNAKMNLDGNINFARGSSFKGLSIYPSFGIVFSPLEIILNPTEFSHTAMAHWTSDYKSTVTKYREYRATGDVYDVTQYTSTWIDNYGNKTMSCKDVQPFLFIGPRIATNTTHYLKNSLISSAGINIGYRRGALFLNGFVEKANIYFQEPFSRSQDTSGFNNTVFAARLDGEFKKSSKFGTQIGVELVNWIQSKDFIYKESRVKRATAFTSIICFAGIGVAQFGDLQFVSDSGRVSYETYLQQHPSETQYQDGNVLLNSKSANFYSFGLQFGLGAIALNMEYSLYTQAYKKLNNWNVGISYNLPVLRTARALKMNSLKVKLRNMEK